MKKTYISPEALTVQLGTMQHMMTGSQLSIYSGSSATPIDNSGDILVKEQSTSDVNLWDDEW